MKTIKQTVRNDAVITQAQGIVDVPGGEALGSQGNFVEAQDACMNF